MGMVTINQVRSGSIGGMKERAKKLNIFVIGATGAIGLPFVRYCIGMGHTVIAGLHRSPLPSDVRCEQEFGVDVTDKKSLERVFQRHKIDVVWNLAAPLSVESENNPQKAKNITVRFFFFNQHTDTHTDTHQHTGRWNETSIGSDERKQRQYNSLQRQYRKFRKGITSKECQGKLAGIKSETKSGK